MTAVRVEALRDRIVDAATAEEVPRDADEIVETLLDLLEQGEVRAAHRDPNGRWRAVSWVKQGILLGFRIGRVVRMGGDTAAQPFFDKHTYPPRALSVDDGVRVVPGGSSIRRGAYVGRGVVCMPPMYINVGAWVGQDTMIDSHTLVGSCAQIGARVHVSAGAQIGGVLEPVNASPVVIEDDVLVGGNGGIYDGTVVRARAVIAAGVVLTRGTPVFDLVHERVYKSSSERPLEIPREAVVVPGARAVRSTWGIAQRLSVQTPIIVKYRDDRTDHATALETWLR